MRRTIVTLGLLMLLAIPAAAAAQPVPPVFCSASWVERYGPFPAGECSVFISDNWYSPNPAEVPVGTTVTWRNQGGQAHTVDEPAYLPIRFFSGPIEPGGAFSFTFNEPGSFPYTCDIHPEMSGTVIVTY